MLPKVKITSPKPCITMLKLSVVLPKAGIMIPGLRVATPKLCIALLKLFATE